MDNKIHKGTISFINHTKKNAIIDYELAKKKKTISFKTDVLLNEGPDTRDKKAHHYRAGDEVTFKVKMSDRGDKMVAWDIKFLYNTAIEKLTQRAAIDNSFRGYLKIVDGDYYVKEIDSYLFFPLLVSKWEKAPPESAFNEAIDFRLLNLDKPNSISAELFSHDFIPEYKKAQHHLKSKTPVKATVTRISPYALYLDLFDGKIQAKADIKTGEDTQLKEGDSIQVVIIHLTGSRVVAERLK